MTPQIVFSLVGGAIAILAIMLAVVVIARRMDRTRSLTASDATNTGAKLLAGGGVGAAVAQAIKQVETNRETRGSPKHRARTLAGAGGAIIAASIGASVALGRNHESTPPPPVEITAGDLHGTLLSPRKKAPVVLIVPGSGPTDRDGNNPLGVKANSYRLLAQGLAEKGIATVRVDKRGMFGSAAAGGANAVTVESYAQDYRAWIDAIRMQTGRKCVWLLGHSEGALMVSAAAEGRSDVCGLILVSGMGRRMGDVLREQLKANPANAPLIAQAFAAIADLEAGRHPDTSGMHPALLPLFSPEVQDFLISVFAVDPVDLVRRARVKTLVIQGTTDLQVSVEDARLLNNAPRTTMKLIKGMNHVLKEAPEDRAANIAAYSDPGLPLHPKLAREIANFIEGGD